MANPRRLPRLRRVGRGLLSVSVSFAALVVSIGLFPGSAHSKVKFHPLSDQIKRFEDVVIRPHHTLHRRDTLDKRSAVLFRRRTPCMSACASPAAWAPRAELAVAPPRFGYPLFKSKS